MQNFFLFIIFQIEKVKVWFQGFRKGRWPIPICNDWIFYFHWTQRISCRENFQRENTENKQDSVSTFISEVIRFALPPIMRPDVQTSFTLWSPLVKRTWTNFTIKKNNPPIFTFTKPVSKLLPFQAIKHFKVWRLKLGLSFALSVSASYS